MRRLSCELSISLRLPQIRVYSLRLYETLERWLAEFILPLLIWIILNRLSLFVPNSLLRLIVDASLLVENIDCLDKVVEVFI